MTTKTATKTKTPKRHACRKCGKTKAAAQFSSYASAKNGTGLNTWCRACCAAYSGERRLFKVHAAALGLSNEETIALGRALKAGLTEPLTAAKSGAKTTAKAAARKAAPKAAARKAPASA